MLGTDYLAHCGMLTCVVLALHYPQIVSPSECVKHSFNFAFDSNEAWENHSKGTPERPGTLGLWHLQWYYDVLLNLRVILLDANMLKETAQVRKRRLFYSFSNFRGSIVKFTKRLFNMVDVLTQENTSRIQQ